jgi:small subunit ribosomal protein S31
LPNREDIDLWNGKSSDIFNNMGTVSSDMPVLKTWRALEERELKLLTSCPPANIFQEMILWTEQGKLWKFPIDNEQGFHKTYISYIIYLLFTRKIYYYHSYIYDNISGMEEESNIHFSEHIFMERHLKDWCPKLGPIRHFMELVCNGLSKNPYLTVQEKINHIMWYKEYFESKQDLLQQLEVIQEVFPDKIKKIQE